jgi:hypothetical protein
MLSTGFSKRGAALLRARRSRPEGLDHRVGRRGPQQGAACLVFPVLTKGDLLSGPEIDEIIGRVDAQGGALPEARA